MSHSFQSLLEGVYASVLEARRFVNAQHLKVFQSYFEPKVIDDPATGDKIEVYTPRLLAVATSKGVGERETFDVVEAPVLTLVPLSTLAIDTLEIEFEAKLTDLEVLAQQDEEEAGRSEAEGEEEGIIRRTIHDLFDTASEIKIMPKGDSFESSASPAKIKIAFKMTDPPEGIGLLQEQMLDYIRS